MLNLTEQLWALSLDPIQNPLFKQMLAAESGKAWYEAVTQQTLLHQDSFKHAHAHWQKAFVSLYKLLRHDLDDLEAERRTQAEQIKLVTAPNRNRTKKVKTDDEALRLRPITPIQASVLTLVIDAQVMLRIDAFINLFKTDQGRRKIHQHMQLHHVNKAGDCVAMTEPQFNTHVNEGLAFLNTLPVERRTELTSTLQLASAPKPTPEGKATLEGKPTLEASNMANHRMLMRSLSLAAIAIGRMNETLSPSAARQASRFLDDAQLGAGQGLIGQLLGGGLDHLLGTLPSAESAYRQAIQATALNNSTATPNAISNPSSPSQSTLSPFNMQFRPPGFDDSSAGG